MRWLPFQLNPDLPSDGIPRAEYRKAKFGSLERFFGVLTEHYAGAFPAWLAPVQVAAIPISCGKRVAP